ncbi:MAG: hypothetical protein AAGG75_10925 [Bacteroidota bacterium]
MPKLSQLKPLWLTLMVLGLVYELGCLTYWIKDYGSYTKPIIWLVAGLVTALAALPLLAFEQEEKGTPMGRKSWPKWLVTFLVFGWGAVYIGQHLQAIFLAFEIGPLNSDIVPSLQFYVRRLLSGEFAYNPMQFPGWTVYPTYFPLLWLPYIFSEVLSIDYRWTAYLLFLLAILLYNRWLIRQDISPIEAGLKAALPFVMVFSFIYNTEKVFGHAVELLPIAYYLILCLSTFHRSRWFMALGILLCLLSRYAFTFWLPLYLLFYWIEKGFKPVFNVSLLVLLGVVLLYILPFMSKDWGILQRGLAYYSKTAITQWEPQPWQSKDDIPFHLNQGQSFARYFYDKTELEVADRLSLNRKVHLLACFIAAGLIAAFYFFFRKRGLNTRWFLIIALKFYLTIFYGFFYVPFSYLYMLPLFISLPLFYRVPWASTFKALIPSASSKEQAQQIT